ncbi:hypothetical protein FACS189476_00530 [Spirochaetia bacterium]|nr:hypothetical protein FACS189476_00530 [Spirochaetia bacterium]
MKSLTKVKRIIIVVLVIGIIVSCVGTKYQKNNILTQIEFDALKFQIENKIINLETISDEEYIKIALKISEHIVKKDGPKSENEHYFRNNFSRGPDTLSEMVEIIKNNENNIFGWKLLPPGKSIYHMYGIDGEYNLKFISNDGHFEVVYNKNGEKLTKDNDPLNMGTFNYSSEENYDDHLGYDILPYFKWNNTRETKEIASKTDMDTKEIGENDDAMKRYKEYKELLNQI